jgi:hypothetical protein
LHGARIGPLDRRTGVRALGAGAVPDGRPPGRRSRRRRWRRGRSRRRRCRAALLEVFQQSSLHGAVRNSGFPDTQCTDSGPSVERACVTRSRPLPAAPCARRAA